MNPIGAPFVLLTGERGAGKTTACGRTRDLAVSRGLSCGGFLTRRELDPSGMTLGLTLEDLRTGTRRSLASTREDLGGPRIGHFSMDPGVLSWGVELATIAFAAALDLVILDEIGPLELERGLGFAAALPPAANQPACAVILVVRPSLLETAVRHLVDRSPRTESVTPASREALPRRLIDVIMGARSGGI